MLLRTLKNIPGRVVRASSYSWDGLKSAFLKEEAFRLEALAGLILLVTLAFVPWPLWKKLALAAVFCLIPLVELLNSAIEDLSDLITREHNPMVKNAKDKGSAAVLLALILNFLALAALILL